MAAPILNVKILSNLATIWGFAIYPIKSPSLSHFQMWAFQPPFMSCDSSKGLRLVTKTLAQCGRNNKVCVFFLLSSDFTDHKHGKAHNDERYHKRHKSFRDKGVRKKSINCRVIINGPCLHTIAEEAQGVALVALPCRVHQYMLQFAAPRRVKCRGAQIWELDKCSGKRECTSRINKPNYGSKDHSVAYPWCRSDLVPHVLEGHPPHAIGHTFSTSIL